MLREQYMCTFILCGYVWCVQRGRMKVGGCWAREGYFAPCLLYVHYRTTPTLPLSTQIVAGPLINMYVWTMFAHWQISTLSFPFLMDVCSAALVAYFHILCGIFLVRIRHNWLSVVHTITHKAPVCANNHSVCATESGSGSYSLRHESRWCSQTCQPLTTGNSVECRSPV